MQEQGTKVGLINKPTLNVYDEAMMKKLAASPFVLVAEGWNVKTGLGSRFGSELLKRGFKGKYNNIGTHKEGPGGLWQQMGYQGLDPDWFCPLLQMKEQEDQRTEVPGGSRGLPVYLLTLHAYCSWMPDHEPRVYVGATSVFFPPDHEMGKNYNRKAEGSGSNSRTNTDKSWRRDSSGLHSGAGDCTYLVTVDTHVHPPVSWRSYLRLTSSNGN